MAWADAEVMLASMLGCMVDGLGSFGGDARFGVRFHGAWLGLMRR